LYNHIRLFEPVAAGKIFVAKMIVKPDDCLCLELRASASPFRRLAGSLIIAATALPCRFWCAAAVVPCAELPKGSKA
jgi:hypothetical protein